MPEMTASATNIGSQHQMIFVPNGTKMLFGAQSVLVAMDTVIAEAMKRLNMPIDFVLMTDHLGFTGLSVKLISLTRPNAY
jgi:hypothetical protein